MGIFSKLSNQSRTRKLELFNRVIAPTASCKILDIGAEVDFDGNRGMQLIDSYPWKENITAVNLSEAHINKIKARYPQVNAVVCDACALPWPDKYFDVVYSNAVIEHLGAWQNQRKMASEIMRVAKRWFVTTPNRWYPFEFHLRLPFVTWLPFHGYRRLGRLICYNSVTGKYASGINNDELRLLSARELARLFPASQITKLRVTFMPETLIATGPVA